MAATAMTTKAGITNTKAPKTKEGRAALLGLSFAFMGVLKLLGLERAMFRRWGMSSRQMRTVGVIECAAAMMVAKRETRPLAAAGLTVMSAMLLAVEAGNGEAELVLPRLGLLVIAAREALQK